MRSFLFVTLAAFLAVNLGASGVFADGEPMIDKKKFSTGVTGSISNDVEWTHISMLKYIRCQNLFLAIADQPRSGAYVVEALDGLPFGIGEIMAQDLLREDGGLYYLNFNFLTQKDQKRIYDVSEKYSRSLTKTFQDQWLTFQSILSQNNQVRIDAGYQAYILLGLFSLDWDGLDVTKEMGLRKSATHQDASGNLYTPWAKERGDLVSLKALYWGSHNDDQLSEDFIFSTFGDHDALPRRALPDILWYSRVKLDGNDADLARLNTTAMRWPIRNLHRRYGELLIAMRDRPLSAAEISVRENWSAEEIEDHLAYLSRLQYVELENGKYYAAVPVLLKEDEKMVTAARQAGKRIMEAWLSDNYEAIERDLEGLSATSQGVPFEVVFTEVWHYIFGITNRDLVGSGHFKDPYGGGRNYKGFLPVIWQKDAKVDFDNL